MTFCEIFLFGLWLVTIIVLAICICVVKKSIVQQDNSLRQSCNFLNFLSDKIRKNEKNIETLSDLYFELSAKKNVSKKRKGK